MLDEFVGRQDEFRILERFFKKKSASLIVILGRRRIGKSRFIEEFAKQHPKYTFYQFSGVSPVPETTAQLQRNTFTRQLSIQTGLPDITVDDWIKIFHLMGEKLKSGRVILLLDEISWMGSEDPEFLGKLKNAWDISFKRNPELILFLCGSASTWIERNILSSTGFLGRVSYRMTLEELSLHDCNQFWETGGSRISAYEKLKVLSITGGVPRYLEEVMPTLSAEENIRDLCFRKGGILVNEFDDVFSDLFSRRSPTYKKIVQTLAAGPLDLSEIAKAIEVGQSGFLSTYLDDLVKSGFISRDYTWDVKTGKPSKLSHFRLSDNYVRFYLKYIDVNKPRIEKNDFKIQSMASLPGWETIMGLQFENLVLKNRRLIRNYLGIKDEDVISDNPYFQRKSARKKGCQIDYLIQTRFGGLYLCEIKFSKNPILTDVIKDVQQKIEALHYPKGFSCRPILIHVNGVHQDVEDSRFFSDIIDFSKFLTP
jgi:uncharacterized protein